jgi:hypothetical protein
VDPRRLSLCAILAGSFFLGSIVGALFFVRLGYGTLYIPAVLTGGTGLVYGGYMHCVRARL